MGRAGRQNQTSAQLRNETLFDVFQENSSASETLSCGRLAEQELNLAKNPDEVREILAPVATDYLKIISLRSSRGAPSNPGMALSIALLEYLDKKDSKSLDFLKNLLRRTNNRLELRELLARDSRKIDYLKRLWGQKTEEKISGTTQTRAETVQKWLAGSNPSSENSTRLSHLTTTVYQLENECGVKWQDIPAWLETPRGELSGKTVEDTFAFSSYRWSLPAEITELLRSKGADL